MKRFWFWLRRTHGAPYETLFIDAIDSEDAVRSLPPCVTWDFRRTPPCGV